MRCIQCGTHSKLRERKDGRCPRCRHPFALEPATGSLGITDAAFRHALGRVGAGGVRFTHRQLWHALNRGLARPAAPGRGGESVVVPYTLAGAAPGVAMALTLDAGGLWILAGVGALAGLALGVAVTREQAQRSPSRVPAPRLPFDVFLMNHLQRWVQVHGDVPGLLPPRGFADGSLPREVPADVAAFSFDRAVVTDRWEMAQMLVANRFHFEHNCAVLSVDGFPDGIAETVKAMLCRNPRLTVFALHDASVKGCRLPLTLRQPEWFPGPGVRIVDLGLRPETVWRHGLQALPGTPLPRPAELKGMLAENELAWLAAGNVGELAAVPPAEVMRAAYRGIVAAGSNDGRGRAPAYDGAWWRGGAAVVWFGALAGGATDSAAVDGFG